MFRRVFMVLFLLCTACSGFAQFRWDAGLQIGASNYLGDIGGKDQTRRNFLSDLKLAETKLSLGTFVRYKISRNFSVSGSYNYGRIAGDDKLSSNPGRHNRNLNFRNDIHELGGQGQLTFYSVDDVGNTYTFRNSFRAYIGTGIAVFHHNPKTLYEGEWLALRPLRTEGETKPYSAWGVSIPMSIGMYFTFNRYYRIGWDLCWRKTFTDYLDDVSTVYAPARALPNATSVALANRTGELGLPDAIANNYTPGNKRGDPRHKDSYIFSTLNFSYVFRGLWFKRSGITSHGRVGTHQKKSFRVKF